MDWIALILSISGIILNAKKKIWCWPIWIVSNIFWIIFAIATHPLLWTVLILNILFGITNCYGWWSWHNETPKS